MNISKKVYCTHCGKSRSHDKKGVPDDHCFLCQNKTDTYFCFSCGKSKSSDDWKYKNMIICSDECYEYKMSFYTCFGEHSRNYWLEGKENA